jgi:hypothetical protein
MLGNLILMLAFTVGLTLTNLAWSKKYFHEYTYIYGNSSQATLTLHVFFSFWILTNSVMALNAEVSLQL